MYCPYYFDIRCDHNIIGALWTVTNSQFTGENSLSTTLCSARWRNTDVVVKILHSNMLINMGDFTSELNVLQKVHHPHTVRSVCEMLLQSVNCNFNLWTVTSICEL